MACKQPTILAREFRWIESLDFCSWTKWAAEPLEETIFWWTGLCGFGTCIMERLFKLAPRSSYISYLCSHEKKNTTNQLRTCELRRILCEISKSLKPKRQRCLLVGWSSCLMSFSQGGLGTRKFWFGAPQVRYLNKHISVVLSKECLE